MTEVIRLRDKRRIGESCVAITHHPLEGEAIKAALNLLPIAGLIRDTDTVVITPNWVKAAAVESGTTVGPESLRELLRFVKGKNPKRVVVAAGSGGMTTQEVFTKVGYNKVIHEEQVEFIDLNYGPYIELALAENLRPPSTKINRLLNEVDVLISYTQIKVHEEATVSLGIKNIALGWPPAEIHGIPKKMLGIHTNLHPFIRAMAEKIPIDLTILSGSPGMVGKGPTNGKPVNSGLVVAGTDPVATDTVGARLLGFQPQAVHYLFDLIQRGVGLAELGKEVKLLGMPLNQAEEIFSRAAYGEKVVVDDDQLNPLPENDPIYKGEGYK